MTLLLGLDTATDRATIALGRPDTPAREIALAARRELSRDIERVAAQLLEDSGAAARDLTGVIVADGPGSFTGLRIGIAFAKGLCRALDIPLWTAPSLMGAAWVGSRSVGQPDSRSVGQSDSRSVAPPTTDRLTTDRLTAVIVEYDALRGEVFRAAYGFGGGAVRVIQPPAVVQAGARREAGHLAAGEAQASAAALIALVGVPGGAAAVPEPAAWEPAYGRPAEAEARRVARRGAHER